MSTSAQWRALARDIFELIGLVVALALFAIALWDYHVGRLAEATWNLVLSLAVRDSLRWSSIVVAYRRTPGGEDS
jgi:hypothetical protein